LKICRVGIRPSLIESRKFTITPCKFSTQPPRPAIADSRWTNRLGYQILPGGIDAYTHTEEPFMQTFSPGDKRPLIFAIEEPELYLHPHIQRVMLRTLQKISDIDQVILFTHSPFFVDMINERFSTLAARIVTQDGLSSLRVEIAWSRWLSTTPLLNLRPLVRASNGRGVCSFAA
jgi:hypothetical protein